MSRISASLAGMERALLNRMADANAAAAVSTLRLATMKKINYPSDDPAAFVTLSGYQSALSNVTAAMENATAAGSLITQAQTTIGQVQDQLEIIREALLTPTATSQETIDEALAQINTLASTDINGRRVFDGSADFDFSGLDSSQVKNLRVYTTRGGTEAISGDVLTAGSQATLRYTGSGGVTTDDATITLTGNLGSTTITVTSGELLTELRDDINAASYLTGVTASVTGDNLDFTSVNYGSAAKVSISVAPGGTFVVTGGDGNGTDYGTSSTATINGLAYTASGDNRFQISDNGFRYEVQFQAGYTGDIGPISVSGSALTFALSTDLNQRAALSLPSLQTVDLGGNSGRLDQIGSGGPYSGLGSNTAQAIRIVDEATAQVTRAQGNLGGFYVSSVTSASNLLTDLEEDLQNSIDDIDLVNVAEETSRQVFYEGLAANAIAGLTILNQQRQSIVNLIQHIAGLD